MRVLFLLVGLLLALVALGAEGAMKAGPNMAGPGHHRLKAPGGDAPPLDGFPAPTVAASFYKLLSSYSGPAMRLRRASDNAELNINFLGHVPGSGAPWDEAAAASHCAATNCFVRTAYNQGSLGAAGNVEQATATLQPQVIFNCIGSKPCLQVAATTNLFGLFTAATFTSSTGIQSISVVGNRMAGAPVICHFWRAFTVNTNRIGAGAAAAWVVAGTGGNVTAGAVTEGAWHVAQGVINGAASSITVDGVTTTGTSGGSTAASTLNMNGAVSGATCRQAEAIMWDGHALTAGEVAAMTASQQSRWAP